MAYCEITKCFIEPHSLYPGDILETIDIEAKNISSERAFLKIRLEDADTKEVYAEAAGANVNPGKSYHVNLYRLSTFVMPNHNVVLNGVATYNGEECDTCSQEITCLGATCQQPSLNFEFVEDGCYIRYGDDLFCFADETKDIPPGTAIWTYFRVKNTGEIAARATVKVFDGDTKLCEKTSPAAIPPGSHMNFYTHCFNMSDTNRDLVMKVYEYGKTEELDSLGCR